MLSKFIALLVIIGLGVIILSQIVMRNQESEKSDRVLPDPVSVNQLQVVGWIPYWDQDQALQSARDHEAELDLVTYFWFSLDENGDIKNYVPVKPDAKLVEEWHAKGKKVMMIVANLPDFEEGGDWDPDRVQKVIGTAESRSKHVDSLITVMNQYGFDGINIDYEALRRNQKNQFTQFIQLLGERLDEEDKLLGVAIHPKTGENKPDEANGSQAQDLAALGEASDHLYLMTYDEHNDSSVPGAISSLDWTEEVVTYALSQGVSSEKLFLGVPLYGYEWNLSSGSARGLEYTEVLPLTQGVSLRTDSASLEKTFSYQRGASTFEVWYNDADSVAGKAKLAADMGLKGIALWRLGREDPNIWPTLLELEESD